MSAFSRYDRLRFESLEQRLCLTGPNFVVHRINFDFAGFAGAYALEAADLNADGQDELLLVGTQVFSFLSNSGEDPTRWHLHDSLSGGEVHGVKAVDIDGDSDLDIVIQNGYSRSLRLFQNQGDGFRFTSSELNVQAVAFALGDLDGDQDADAVVAIEDCSASDQTCAAVIRIHENLGAAGWRAGQLIDIQRGLREFALEDVNGDGAIDLLSLASRCSAFDGSCQHVIAWYPSQDGTLQRGIDIGSLGGKADDVVFGDFDRDGDNDVIILSETGGISWTERLDGQIGFAEPRTIRPDGDVIPEHHYPAGGLAVADFDHDGDLDVIDGSRRGRWEYGWSENVATDEVFADTAVLNTTFPPPVHAVAGDFDGDGDADVAMLADHNEYYWLENQTPRPIAGDADGNGVFDSSDLVRVFQAGEYEDGIAGNSTFAEGDWNGDGEFDSADLVYVFQAGTYQPLARIARPAPPPQLPSNLWVSIADSTRQTVDLLPVETLGLLAADLSSDLEDQP